MQASFVWPIRVYWEDTDAGGVVYHARYLHFLERARSEWFRSLGIAQQHLREVDGIVFVVHRMQLAFNAPARLDDQLAGPCASAQSIGQAAGKRDLPHCLRIVMRKSRVLGRGGHGKRKIRQQANVATGG